MPIYTYIIILCKIIICLTFMLSFVGKLLNLRNFNQSIIDFGILPSGVVSIFKWFILISEVLIVFLMMTRGELLDIGFLLSIIILTSFSLAIAINIARKRRIPCNCFGAGEKDISNLDLLRNLTLIGFGVVGLIANNSGVPLTDVALEIKILLLLISIAYIQFILNIDDIFDLYRVAEKGES